MRIISDGKIRLAALAALLALFAAFGGAAPFTQNRGAGAVPRRTHRVRRRLGTFEIYAMNADGSGVEPPHQELRCRRGPRLGRRTVRRRIAFHSNRDGNFEIYAMNADGSGLARLTNNSAHDRSYPSWSPDGRRIAFHSYRDGNLEIYAMNADGSGLARLTNNSADDEHSRLGRRTVGASRSGLQQGRERPGRDLRG